MAPAPTKTGRQERRGAAASPYARPSSSAASKDATQKAPAGVRGFLSRFIWGSKKDSDSSQETPEDPEQQIPVDETLPDSDDEDVVLVQSSSKQEAPSAAAAAAPPQRVPNAQGWNDPPSFVNFSAAAVETSTPAKRKPAALHKSASVFDMNRLAASNSEHTPVSSLEQFFRAKREANETVTPEEAANVVKLVSDAQRPPESDFTFSVPPPPSMGSPKLSTSHSLPSLSTMFKSPANPNTSTSSSSFVSPATRRNRLLYFGPGQTSASALRRARSIAPIPSTSSSSAAAAAAPPAPQDDQVSTKKRKVQEQQPNKSFAQPSYIATPERKQQQQQQQSSVTSNKRQQSPAAALTGQTASAPDPPTSTPSDLKALLAAKRTKDIEDATGNADASSSALQTKERTRAADMMLDMINKEAAAQPKLAQNDIINPYAAKEAPLAKMPRSRSKNKLRQSVSSPNKSGVSLKDLSDAATPRTTSMREQLEQSMPAEYRQALALAHKEAALKEEVAKDTSSAASSASPPRTLRDPTFAPPLPSTSKSKAKQPEQPKKAPEPAAAPKAVEAPAFSFAPRPNQDAPKSSPAVSEPGPTPASAPSAPKSLFSMPSFTPPALTDTSKTQPATCAETSTSAPAPAMPAFNLKSAAGMPASTPAAPAPSAAAAAAAVQAQPQDARSKVLALPESSLGIASFGLQMDIAPLSKEEQESDVRRAVLASPESALPKFSFILA